MIRDRARRTAVIGQWLFACVVPLSALALGAQLTGVLVAATVVAAVACALLWVGPAPALSRASRFALLGSFTLLLATALQCLPLPVGWLEALAPQVADTAARALLPFQEATSGWHAPSVAPAGTRLELLRGAFYLCVLLSALRVVGREGGRTFLIRVVAVSASAMAIAALAHAALSAESVFGLYRPRELHAYEVGRLAPLLNTNHLAAYCNIGFCVALGAAVGGHSIPRPLAIGAATLLAGTSVWAASRGGSASLVVGALLVVGLSWRVRRQFEVPRTEVFVLGACLVAAAFLVALGMSDTARTDLANADFSKFDLARRAFELTRVSPVLGIGRGAFESVFPVVAPPTNHYVTYTNPENIVAQWCVEWGLPVTLAAGVLFGVAFRPGAILAATRPPIGAWVAVVVTLLHDLVDYHLEVPGVVALFAVCVALATAPSSRGSEHARADRVAQPRGLARLVRAAPWAAVAIAVVAILAAAKTAPLAEQRLQLASMAMNAAVPSPAFRAQLRDATVGWPGEPFFPLLGAVRAESAGEGSVVPWIGRALERSPRFGRAHLVLARSLAERSPGQARLEYRLAHEYDEQLQGVVEREARRLVGSLDDGLELVSPGPAGTRMLSALAQALGARLPATAALLDRELARRAPASREVVERRVRAILSDLQNGEPWCAARAACVASGLAALDGLQEAHAGAPDVCELHVLGARLRAASGDVQGGLDGLERALEKDPPRGGCQRALIELAIASGQRRRADATMARVLRGGCGTFTECAELYQWASGTEESRGNVAQAVALQRRAVTAVQSSGKRVDGLLEHLGALSERAGMLSEAIRAYDELARLHPDNPRYPSKLAELRAAVLSRGTPSAVLPTP